MKYPEDFASAVLDLEIDFGDKGGIQRFKNVVDFQVWLNEEQEFWNFVSPSVARQFGELQPTLEAFWNLDRNCRNHLNQAEQGWVQRTAKSRELESQLSDDSRTPDQKEQIRIQITDHEQGIIQFLESFKAQITSIIQNEIINSRQHLSRFEPVSHFLKEISETEPTEAVFALDQTLLISNNIGERRRCEHAGRMIAELYHKNLNRKVRPDQKAFAKAVETWSRELADFKKRYEDQEEKFRETSASHSDTDAAWAERSEAMAAEFAEMRTRSESDLKSLTETYENHMQLRGPLVYWRGKRDQHGKQIKRLTRWSVFTGIAGLIALILAASNLLPAVHPAETVPWRQIGFFVLTSTFVLWIVRLLVKLLLSHIHLYADAEERVVMISTFMALVRRQESREGLSKIDISLVLAPLFKPSTTGVIKDDGGPATLGDFIGRLAGK